MHSNTTMNSNIIQIENRLIGPSHPVFIIAEIGVNHNGDKELAKRTIEAAAKAGVDCVKFQTWRTDEFMADRDLEYGYVSGGRQVKEKMYDMFKRLELPLEWHRELFEHTRSIGLVPLTSVADTICADTAIKAGLTALKLASEDLINLPLLDYVSSKKVPLLLSTGMADEEEIKDAISILDSHNALNRTIFMHCVSLYPTPDHSANLSRITTLAKMTNGIVGYSDHTMGTEACLAAVAMRACILEKHFTLDKNLPGPDHMLSADMEELRRLVLGVRRLERQLGDSCLEPADLEIKARVKFRRSLVAAHDLPAGTALKPGDLALKRPGNGIRPKEMGSFFGRTLTSPLRKNEQLKQEIVD